MYQYIPKRTNQTARKLILLFFAGAAALMLITMIARAVPFRWVFQLIALFLLTAAIFLVTRYVTKLFLYRIESGDLTVIETDTRGKKRLTVCRVGIANVSRVHRLTDQAQTKAILAELRGNKIKVFDYTVDLRPSDSILAVVNEGGEDLAVRLSFDEQLFALLSPETPSGEE